MSPILASCSRDQTDLLSAFNLEGRLPFYPHISIKHGVDAFRANRLRMDCAIIDLL